MRLINRRRAAGRTLAACAVFALAAGLAITVASAKPEPGKKGGPSCSPYDGYDGTGGYDGYDGCVQVPGKMTGNASIVGTDVQHDFTLHCSVNTLPNQLEVKWGKGKSSNKFTLEYLTSASCTNDPTIVAKNPTADFNTFTGTGVGRCNGQPATAQFTFTDAGKPGTSDTASISLSGGCQLSVAGTIKGDQQARDN